MKSFDPRQTNPQTRQVTLDEIRAALERALVVNSGALQINDTLLSEGAIDSLSLQMVVLELEDLTGLVLNVAEVAQCRTVSDIHRLIQAQHVS